MATDGYRTSGWQTVVGLRMAEDGWIPLDIACEVHEGTLIVLVSGELDTASRGRLAATVAAELDRHQVEAVIIDLGALEFMDSTGLHDIALLCDSADRLGVTVSVHGTRPHVRRVFEITRLEHFLDD